MSIGRVLGVTALLSCGSRVPPSPDGGELVGELAPAAPPRVLLSETAPALLLFDWEAIDGRRTWPASRIAWPPRRSPVSAVTLATSAIPIRVELRGFDAVDLSTGIPRQGAIATWSCGLDQPVDCQARTQGDSVNLDLPAVPSAQPYLTLQVYWFVPPEQRRTGLEDVGEVTATWILGPPQTPPSGSN